MKQRYTSIPKYARFLAIAVFFAATSITLQAQSITLLAPNGGESWIVGSYENVSWTGQGLENTLSLEFSPDGGSSWWAFGQVSSSSNGGSSQVYVPFFLSSNARLKISSLSNPAVNDISDGTFTVSYPPIFINEPYTGSVIFVNNQTYIDWDLYEPGISLLNAEISTDNGLTYSPLAQNINATTGYTYLTLSETPADACILKLYNAEDPSEFGLSGVFQINPVPVYTLTSPVEGQIANTNSLLTISWNVQNPYSEENYIEFSSDNGETWEIVAYGSSLGNSGSLIWFTPNVNSDECLLRINDYYSSSNDVSDKFTIMPYPETPICMVTVDSLTNQNVIIWEKPASDIITDFLVYKETDEFDVYEVIDTVSYQDVPMATDFESNPAIRPYRYKLGFMDSESRVFPVSDYHQTIHLTINQGVNGNWNLIWTPYTGIDYTSYKIMRSSGNGDFEQIASVSASFSSYTDFDAPAGDIAYMVKIVNPEGCNTGLRNAVYTDIYSNQASASPVQVNDPGKTAFNIYPVPANDRISVQFGDNVKGTIRLTLTDVTGRVIYSTEYSDVRQGQVYSVNTSEFNEGIYLLNVISADSRNTRKIVVRH